MPLFQIGDHRCCKNNVKTCLFQYNSLFQVTKQRFALRFNSGYKPVFETEAKGMEGTI